jgi:hypothetical protein
MRDLTNDDLGPHQRMSMEEVPAAVMAYRKMARRRVEAEAAAAARREMVMQEVAVEAGLKKQAGRVSSTFSPFQPA